MLRLSMEEDSEWREARSNKCTSDMCMALSMDTVSKITRWRQAYDKLPEKAKGFCTQHFVHAMAVDYVHNSNIGEMVGTQSWQETQAVIRRFCEDHSTSLSGVKPLARCEKETVNTYEVLKLLHNTHKVMDKTGFLTVQEICDAHRVLLQGLHPDRGNIRTRDAYTHWHGGLHYYPPPKQAEELFYALIDHHNKRITECPYDSTTEEYTAYIFKCAANLLYEFVSVHPFGDGNGRMCRLLANYVIGLITPFPVSLCHSPKRNAREDYLNAIVHCREHPEDRGPHALTAMLMEGAFRGWNYLFQNLERRHELEPGVTIGPIVIRKSDCSVEYVTERVNRIWAGILRSSVKATMECVVTAIVHATQEFDVRCLSCTQYIQNTVPVAEDVSVVLDIFGP